MPIGNFQTRSIASTYPRSDNLVTQEFIRGEVVQVRRAQDKIPRSAADNRASSQAKPRNENMGLEEFTETDET